CVRASSGRRARTPVASGALPGAVQPQGGRHVSIWQRVVATILALAAGVVVVVAVVDDDSQSGAAQRVATTPVWSVRRVRQPLVAAGVKRSPGGIVADDSR